MRLPAIIYYLYFSRGDKRHMEKKNLKARADRKKADNARVRELTDLALKVDPRIKKYKDMEKDKKEADRKAKERVKEEAEQAAKKVQEEARQVQLKADEEAKAKAEEDKKEKDAKKNNVRNFRKKIRQEVKDHNYYLAPGFGAESKEVIEAMVQLEKVCESSSIDDLAALSDLAAKGPREFEEGYRNQLKKFYDEKSLPPPLGMSLPAFCSLDIGSPEIIFLFSCLQSARLLSLPSRSASGWTRSTAC